MSAFHVKYTAATNIGSHDENQDNLIAANKTPLKGRNDAGWSGFGSFDTDNAVLFAVFDGVSQTKGAKAAAAACADVFNTELQKLKEEADPEEWLRRTFDRADNILIKNSIDTKVSGACTAAVLLLKKDRWYFANLGDSPAFLIRDARITEISELHNVYSIKMRYNESRGLTPENGNYAHIEPKDRSRLALYLGHCPDIPSRSLHFISGTLFDGDRFIVCTDGITATFSPKALKPLKTLPAGIIAKIAGRKKYADNCTCISLKVRSNG